jgi:uncharacterized membrane protein
MPFFTKEEDERIVQEIFLAEEHTSGELRVYVEDYCFRDHPVERAAEVFALFGMHNTKNRNAVLLYLATKSHHLAIWGDIAIHDKVGPDFWETERNILINALREDHAAQGVCEVIRQIGQKIKLHFPAGPGDTRKNELPNDILYG